MNIQINGKSYADFSSVEIKRSIDSVASTFSFSAYFDNQTTARTFRPLDYQDILIHDDFGNLLLTGVCLNTYNEDIPEGSLHVIDGYSKCGVIGDANVPVNVNSLQNNNMSLKDITEKLINPFGLKLIIDSDSSKRANEKIKRSYTYMNEKLDRYIVDIALRKKIIVSHDVYGNLLFLSISSDVKTKRSFNRDNCVSMSLSVDGQNMHSEISSTRQVSRRSRKNPSPQVKSATVVNPLIKVYRPKNNRTNINSDLDLNTSAESFFMQELENISLVIKLEKYYPDISVGDFIEVVNDRMHIFKPARMLIKETIIRRSESGETMELTCVIPEAYTGETPKNIFE